MINIKYQKNSKLLNTGSRLLDQFEDCDERCQMQAASYERLQNFIKFIDTRYIRWDILFYFGFVLWVALCMSDIYHADSIFKYNESLDLVENYITNSEHINNHCYPAPVILVRRNIVQKPYLSMYIVEIIVLTILLLTFLSVQKYIKRKIMDLNAIKRCNELVQIIFQINEFRHPNLLSTNEIVMNSEIWTSFILQLDYLPNQHSTLSELKFLLNRNKENDENILKTDNEIVNLKKTLALNREFNNTIEYPSCSETFLKNACSITALKIHPAINVKRTFSDKMNTNEISLIHQKSTAGSETSMLVNLYKTISLNENNISFKPGIITSSPAFRQFLKNYYSKKNMLSFDAH